MRLCWEAGWEARKGKDGGGWGDLQLSSKNLQPTNPGMAGAGF